MLRFFGFCLVWSLVFSSQLFAQDPVTESDTTRTGYATGTLNLPNPSGIVAAYRYDPILDRYIYTETIGRYNFSVPLILTPDEYQELVIQEEIRNYFREKNNAIAA